MAASHANKHLAARAAAILTTSEVAGATLDLNLAFNSQVTVDLSFTKGSLTNVVVKFYVSADGVTWKSVTVSGAVMTETITADAERAFVMPALSGWKFFRASLTGTGTVTSSTATLFYRYLQAGSQS